MTRNPRIEVEELTSRLVGIPSVTGNEQAVTDWLSIYLQGLGLRIHRQPVSPDRSNLVAAGAAQPELLFCTHLDTVGPWFGPELRDGILFGRGACDAKGIAAAMVCATAALLAAGETRVGLLLVVGEETDSVGAKAAAASGLRCRYLVVGEPTGNRLVAGQKGTLVFRLSAQGRSGHSADPAAGPSAIQRLLRVLGRLDRIPWPVDPRFGSTDFNVGRIEGGVTANVVADSAIADGIFRVSTSTREVEDGLLGCLEDGVELKVVSRSEPLQLETIPGFPTCTVAFGSDAPYLTAVGRVLMAGPGSIRYAHRPDEQVPVAELTAAIDLYMDLARTLLARD